MHALILLCSLLALCHSRDLSQEYRFSSQLDGENYVLYWKFDYQSKKITFAVRVKTSGWIGFGLSPNGQMPQSDVVIGWVERNSRAVLQDRFARARATPPIDTVQNWFLIRGDERNGTTTLEFWRNFTSCDESDLEIGKTQTVRVIWSYYPDDPSNSIGRFPVHTKQGNRSLNLLGGLQDKRSVPSDSASFILRNNQVLIPNNTDFVYWCSYQEHSVPPGDIYIYKAEPLISSESVNHIQHMVLTVCPSYVESSLLTDGPCADTAWLCYYGDGLPGWANGGQAYTYPEDVALHVRLETGQRLYMGVHYDNPNRDSGIFDSSGMKYYYTRQRPIHVAGVMTVEFNTFPYITLVVPPNAEEFNITASCPTRCHNEDFPEEGITIFSTFHHSNILGKATIARHSRRNVQCNADEELETIDQNLHFDYKFQQYTVLQKRVTLQKNDVISVTCVYNSKRNNRTGVTVAGLSRRDEQCYIAFEYYPKMNLTYCGTHTNALAAYGSFLDKYLPKSEVNDTLEHFDTLNSAAVAKVFNSIQWTPENISDLQQSLKRADAINGYCWYDYSRPNDKAFVEFTMDQPAFDCHYEAPNQCKETQPVPCCDQLNSNTAQQRTTAIAAGVSSGLIGVIIGVLVVLSIVTMALWLIVNNKRKATASVTKRDDAEQ